MFGKPKLSVVISTYNRKEIMQRVLFALDSQTIPPEAYEVIVIDDGSSDGTGELVNLLIKKVQINLKYIYQDNSGTATAKNRGINESRADLILILNDDAIAHNHLLEGHIQTHTNLSIEKLAVLGNFDWDRNLIDNPFMMFMAKNTRLFEYPIMQKGFYDYMHFYTCNISMARKRFIEIGLFDENFRLNTYDDLELGYRHEKNGGQLFFDPDLKCTHHHTIKLKSYIARVHFEGINLIKFATKHPELLNNDERFSFLHNLREYADSILKKRKKYEEAIRFLEQMEKLSLLQYGELKANAIKKGSGFNYDRQLEDSIKLVYEYEKYRTILGTFGIVNYYITRYIVRNITRPFRRVLRKFNTKKTKV